MLNISNIQHFSVGDGDGIRTTIFLKGCNLRCPWCHNPENLTTHPVTLNYKNLCKTETVGRRVHLEEILHELLEDRDFYDESGGGVTFSGGEAMLQAGEVAKAAATLKENGVSVMIDTAGCVPYEYFELTNHVVDGYLFDFKTADAKKYKTIGGNLSLVKENLVRLSNDGVLFTVRIPLIPGFNTDTESIRGICTALQNIGISHVELIPFHRLGMSKYEAMGLTYAYKDTTPPSRDEIRKIEDIYKEYFTVKTE